MRSLEVAITLITSQLTRFLMMMMCFYNMIDASMHMLS